MISICFPPSITAILTSSTSDSITTRPWFVSTTMVVAAATRNANAIVAATASGQYCTALAALGQVALKDFGMV